MQICVVGWHGHKDLYVMLQSIAYPVVVISHKEDNDYLNLHTKNIPNIGLEFGAYDYYLKNIWEGGSVLFMHDDMIIDDVSVFDEIFRLKCDCSYIFRDSAEHMANGGKHGRTIYCSERFLEVIKETECKCHWCQEKEDLHHNPGTILPKIWNGSHKGFWFDPNNKGHVSGKPPVGIRHYNSAIEHFHWVLGRVRDQRYGNKSIWPNPKEKMDVVNRSYFFEIVAGRRNCWKHVDKEILRYTKNERKQK
jgi:hypothetical protein